MVEGVEPGVQDGERRGEFEERVDGLDGFFEVGVCDLPTQDLDSVVRHVFAQFDLGVLLHPDLRIPDELCALAETALLHSRTQGNEVNKRRSGRARAFGVVWGLGVGDLRRDAHYFGLVCDSL